ncbi:hypothetical protein [Longirhabdus pacifica]|uniref:hypothetical protein n=1 Tax=Longirhabdus pacifica TaxID=2305227 RepID=UPI001008E867|nr:hypothetical protein [Longirhabdus pacifica]
MQTVCQWCQTEIMMDEKNPETTCPHCENELGDYKSMQIPMEMEEEDATEQENTVENHEESEEEDLFFLEEDFMSENDEEELEVYETYVDQSLQQTEGYALCKDCEEQMIFTGQQKVTADTFQSNEQLQTPFLVAPYHMDVFLCPHCFQQKTYLSTEDRADLMQRLKQKG